MNGYTSAPSERRDHQDRIEVKAPAGFPWRRVTTGVSVAVLLACLIALTRLVPVDRAVQALQAGVDQLGPLGPAVFGGAYVLAGLLFVPGSALTIASGALFGLLWGTLIVSVSSTVTAALAFLIARHLARGSVQRAAQRNARFAAIDRAVGRGGWKIVALLRLSPAVPYSLGNYLYGLTSIRFWPYVLASWVCMLPGTFMYVYIGHLGAQGLQAASGASSAVGTGKAALLVAGLAATVVVTVYVTRLARRALAEQGAFEADAAPALQGAAPNTGHEGGLALRTMFPPILAVLALAGTVWAWTRQDALRGLFGPPAVTLQEAYPKVNGGPTFDHSKFDGLLRKHVSEGGWVDYKGLQSDAAPLDEYIATLENAPFDALGRDEKLALLINAYNAFTLRLILDHYPVKSIKDIPDAQRWDAKRWKLARNTWSLNQIEHEQIRPKFREPRIHFALVCAAVGCPPLRSQAYTGARLEEQLADQTRYVHTHDRWFQFDPKGGVVRLTKLYDWYGSDFKQIAGSALEYAAQHSEALQKALDEGRKSRIEWLDYNWRLNDRESRP